jgi:hypothetical protein
MKSTAEQIVEPLEIVWQKLVRLSKETYDLPIDSNSVYAIAQEMDAALSFLRRNIEGILESELPPDDFYKHSDDSSREFVRYDNDDDAVVPKSTQEPSIWESFKSHLYEGMNYNIIRSRSKQLVKYGGTASKDLFEDYANEESLSDLVDKTTHRGEEK